MGSENKYGGGAATRPFRGMEARRNSAETQQSSHAPRSGSEIKNGSSAKDGCVGETHMRENPEGELDRAMMSAGTARRILLPFYPV